MKKRTCFFAMIKTESAHACVPWEAGTEDQGTRNPKKKRYTGKQPKTYIWRNTIGTGKEIRVTKKETMNTWLGKEMWTTFTVGGVVKALEGQQ